MEVKDLMIGDWVRITRSQWHEGSTQKVLDVYENGSIRTNHISPVLKDSYEPVLLTPEILEANGWKLDEELSGDDPCFVLDLSNEDPNWMRNLYWSNDVLYLGEYHYCDCFFVHQLQHALRLLGKYDKADNFKLE